MPERAAALMLIIEDADNPTLQPLVHAITYDFGPETRSLREGALSGSLAGNFAMGRNSYLRTRYLPPDPSPGHGAHRYAFQILAVDRRADFSDAPGRGDLVDALRRRVLAAGCLIGTYERP